MTARVSLPGRGSPWVLGRGHCRPRRCRNRHRGGLRSGTDPKPDFTAVGGPVGRTCGL